MKKVFFDMDGVLADFDRGVAELCGLAPLDQSEQDARELKMWAEIRKVDRFYAKLEPMPGAVALFNAVRDALGENCEILTGIPKPHRGVPTAGEDKIDWVRRVLSPDVKVNVVYKENKKDFCTGPDSILVDDFPANIAAWEAIGGTGILFRTAAEAAARLRALGVLPEEGTAL